MTENAPWCDACKNRTDCPLHNLQTNVAYTDVAALLKSPQLNHQGRQLKGDYSSRTFGSNGDRRRYEVDLTEKNKASLACWSMQGGFLSYVGRWLPFMRNGSYSTEIKRDMGGDKEKYFELLGDVISLSWADHLVVNQNSELAQPEKIRVEQYIEKAKEENEYHRKLYVLGNAFGNAVVNPYQISLLNFFNPANQNSIFHGYGQEVIKQIVDGNYVDLTQAPAVSSDPIHKIYELTEKGSKVIPRIAGPLSMYNKVFLNSNLSSTQIGKTVRITSTVAQKSFANLKKLMGASYIDDPTPVPPQFRGSIPNAPVILADNKFGINLDHIKKLVAGSKHCPAGYKPTETCLYHMRQQYNDRSVDNPELARFLDGKISVLEHMSELVDLNYPYMVGVWDENPDFRAFREELKLPEF